MREHDRLPLWEVLAQPREDTTGIARSDPHPPSFRLSDPTTGNKLNLMASDILCSVTPDQPCHLQFHRPGIAIGGKRPMSKIGDLSCWLEMFHQAVPEGGFRIGPGPHGDKWLAFLCKHCP